MAKFVSWVKKFVREEEGPTMVEYALMLALIAVVSIVIVGTLGLSVSGVFDTINAAMP